MNQVCVSTQASLQREAAEEPEQQCRQQQSRQKQLVEECAREKAYAALLPLLERSVAAAEAAQRVASQKEASATRALEAVRPTAERAAREAAAARADREAAAEERVVLTEWQSAVQYELAYLRVVAAAATEEIALLDEMNVDLEDTVVGLWELLQEARAPPLCALAVS